MWLEHFGGQRKEYCMELSELSKMLSKCDLLRSMYFRTATAERKATQPSCYRPQTKFGARLYFHSVNGGEVCLSACWDTSPGRTPLQGNPPSGTPPPGRPPSKETPQAHTQVGNWGGSDPGPQPRRKLRGIRSRPTAKGEIEGDQIQAHTQGGKLRGIRPRPPPMTTTAAGGTHPTGMHSCYCCNAVPIF